MYRYACGCANAKSSPVSNHQPVAMSPKQAFVAAGTSFVPFRIANAVSFRSG
jgi:hypothetical protein